MVLVKEVIAGRVAVILQIRSGTQTQTIRQRQKTQLQAF
jgi:hypothetical protein